jgi:hypothetical protein
MFLDKMPCCLLTSNDFSEEDATSIFKVKKQVKQKTSMKQVASSAYTSQASSFDAARLMHTRKHHK